MQLNLAHRLRLALLEAYDRERRHTLAAADEPDSLAGARLDVDTLLRQTQRTPQARADRLLVRTAPAALS